MHASRHNVMDNCWFKSEDSSRGKSEMNVCAIE